jgi:hypothetical protein
MRVGNEIGLHLSALVKPPEARRRDLRELGFDNLSKVLQRKVMVLLVGKCDLGGG